MVEVGWFSGQAPSLISGAECRPHKGLPPLSKRRTRSSEFKPRVAMEAISGRKTIQEIAADHAFTNTGEPVIGEPAEW